MSNRVENVFLKLTSAVVFDGLIHRAGAIIEMVEHEAKDLLRRGKAVLATVADHPQASEPEESETSTELPANELQASAPVAPKKGSK